MRDSTADHTHDGWPGDTTVSRRDARITTALFSAAALAVAGLLVGALRAVGVL